MAAPLQHTAAPSLPHPKESYHGKSITLQHEKEIKRTKEFITQQFKFTIEIMEGQMFLFIQKDGQRRVKSKKESEINALVKDIIRKVLAWMEFDNNLFEDTKMTKPQIVEFMCAVFHIPTTKTLSFTEEEAGAIGQHLIEMHQNLCLMDLAAYIRAHHTNLVTIADILEKCYDDNVNVTTYLSELWLGCIDNFAVHGNNDETVRNTPHILAMALFFWYFNLFSHFLSGD
eukprot:448547_1